jgi:N-acetylmuramoyl-L-alanine amidase
MRSYFLLAASLLLPPACGRLYAGQVNFVYPMEGSQLPSVQKAMVFGNVVPATCTLTLNGEKVAVHSNGAFIAYLPVTEGDFSFNAQLSDGTTAQRRIKVKAAQEQKAAPGAMRLEINNYASDSEVSPGDYLRVAASGTPGREAVFSLEGVFKDEPMTEYPAGSGSYYGAYRVADTDRCRDCTLTARFKAGLFARGASARAKGRVKILRSPYLLETSTDTVILRNAPDGGYMVFLQKGVKLIANGRSNGMRRVALSPAETAWVEDSKVQPASPVAPAWPALTETGTIKLRKTDFGSSALVTVYDRVPYTAEETATGLRLTLYYSNSHTNYVVYDSSDTFVKNVAFRQAAQGVVQVDFETSGEVWGYNVAYSTAAKGLQVDLRSRPKPSLAWPRPLSGVTVVLDPGHSPYLKCDNNSRPPLQSVRFSQLPASAHCSLDGAVGPMETFEVNVNMAIAQKLKVRLAELGAEVKLTRNGDDNVDLGDRPKAAKDLGGDLFISVHNNAVGDGEDPFSQPRGFTLYYYQRQSRALADALHRAYLRGIPLPDEGMRYGDYLVVRMTWMPAALIENAYMILPRQEEQLNTPAFQAQLAAAAAEGVLEFFHVPPQPQKVKK